MTAILHLDPASRPRNMSGRAMPYAVLTLLRAGTDEILETHTADSAGEFAPIAPDFVTYVYRVQLRDQYGVLIYDTQVYKPAYANYVDAQSRRIVDSEILPAMEFYFRATPAGSLVALYADPDLAVSMVNPVKTDSSGLLPLIYKAPGAYYMESQCSCDSIYFPGAAYPLEVALDSSASPTVAGAAATSAAITTYSVTVTATGGTGPYTYAWMNQSGMTGISTTSPATRSTTFSATGLALPETRTGTARCTVTDRVGATDFVDVAVSISRTATPGALDATAAPSPLSVSQADASYTTESIGVTPTGGTLPYTVAATWLTGGSGITIDSPTSISTTLTATELALPETRTGTLRFTVTDFVSATKTVDVSVVISRAEPLTMSAAPTPIEATSIDEDITTSAATATVLTGTAPVDGLWAWSEGGDGIQIDSPTSLVTTFTALGLFMFQSRVGLARFSGVDANSFGAVTNEVLVTITRSP